MRIDPRLDRTGLNTRQICFIECWGSLSHKDSLDTDRVSFNNILNAINEIEYLYHTPGIAKREKKRKFVAGELVAFLKEDTALQNPIFRGIPDRILHLLDYKAAWNDTGRSPIEKDRGLMENYFIELRNLLIEHYIPINIVLLENELAKTSVPLQDDYATIINLCNNIMSFMLTLGIPLKECNYHYVRTLLNRNHTFSARFNSWKLKVNVKEQQYTVRLLMENNKLYDMLTSATTQTVFNGCSYSNYINAHSKKITAVEIEVTSFSILAAKLQSDNILSDSLDVVAYMLGAGEINKHNAFSVTDATGYITYINDFNNEILTNADRLTLNAFSHFMDSMTTLLQKSSPVSSRKMSAAFRFLRNGIAIKDSEENRFSAYWSALESLTKGVSSENLDHDDHVAHTTPSCMGFDYIIKQLISIRGMSKTLNIKTPLNGVIVEPENETLYQIYLYLKDPNFITGIRPSFQNYPYAFYTIMKFTELCNDARKMGDKIIKHSDKVKRHLYRLYILRNAIAHNAESNPHIVFLTANLEHYLRGTITAMFYTSTMIETVDSPESAYQRYLDMYEMSVHQLEPTYSREEKEHKEINGNIIKGKIIPNDSLLQDWIKLH